MRRNKSAADPETDQTPKSCQALPTTSAVTESQDRKDVKREEERDIKDDKGGKQSEYTSRRKNPTSSPHQCVSLKRLLNVENILAFGTEMLPVFSKSLPSSSSSLQASLPSHTASASSSSLSGTKAHKSRHQKHRLNLSFLPPIDKGLFLLLHDADLYYSVKKYTEAICSLNTALQFASEGHVLKDMLCADPEHIDLVISYIRTRLVVCYLRVKMPQLAREHAHRSIQLNPSHFQNHLREAIVYRMLDNPCQAAKSALTADWLYCLLGGTERHISTQLKLYWQAMLCSAQVMEKDIYVMYSPYSGEPTAKDISQAEEVYMKQYPAFTGFIYTDPRGGHILPQTTDWLSAVPPHYLITLGFRKIEEGIIIKKICSSVWPSLPDTGGKRAVLSPEEQKKEEVETQKLCDMYEKILPILDLMQATRINSGVCVGSGLMEWLQYGNLLVKLGHQREHRDILHRCLAQVTTAPYLAEMNTLQENILLQALLRDIMDEQGGRGSSTKRVWNKICKVDWLEELSGEEIPPCKRSEASAQQNKTRPN